MQAAGRRVAHYALLHVLGLDLAFHLDRKTGGWLRSGPGRLLLWAGRTLRLRLATGGRPPAATDGRPGRCVRPPHARAGSLSRMLERGTRSVAMIFRAIVFTFVPTALELAGV